MIPQDRMTPEGRMTQQRRAGAGTVRVLVLVGAAALLLAACASAAPSVSPSATPGASSPASVAPTASAAVVATPVPTVLPSASTPSTCPALPQSVALPSDRFTDLRVTGTTGADRLTFVFGDPSLPGPAGPPRGELEAAAPPYTSAGSGAPIAMTGDHVVVVRFSGMSLSNDAGQETYDGPRRPVRRGGGGHRLVCRLRRAWLRGLRADRQRHHAHDRPPLTARMVPKLGYQAG
jgi:hypothetical protein